jgi:hypothetical protein
LFNPWHGVKGNTALIRKRVQLANVLTKIFLPAGLLDPLHIFRPITLCPDNELSLKLMPVLRYWPLNMIKIINYLSGKVKHQSKQQQEMFQVTAT